MELFGRLFKSSRRSDSFLERDDVFDDTVQSGTFDVKYIRSVEANMKNVSCVFLSGDYIFTGRKNELEKRRKDRLGKIVASIDLCGKISNIYCPDENGPLYVGLKEEGTEGNYCVKKVFVLFSSCGFQERVTFQVPSKVFCFEKIKNVLFCGLYSGKIFSWDFEFNGEYEPFSKIQTFHRRCVYSIQVFHNTLLSSSQDGTIRQWNLATGAQINRFAFRKNPIFAVRFFPDDSLVFFQKLLGVEVCKHILTGYGTSSQKQQVSETHVEKEHYFRNITKMDLLPSLNIFLGWEQKEGEIRFYDLRDNQCIHSIHVPETIFVKFLVADVKEEEIDVINHFYVYYGTSNYLGRVKVRMSNLLRKKKKKFGFLGNSFSGVSKSVAKILEIEAVEEDDEDDGGFDEVNSSRGFVIYQSNDSNIWNGTKEKQIQTNRSLI